MEPQGPVRPSIPPLPAHITTRSLPYSQPGPPLASQGNPPSYVNPGQGNIQQESTTSFTQQIWPQGKLKLYSENYVNY